MRSIKLVPMLTATAALLALAPGASARPAGTRHTSAGGSCRVRIEVPRGPVTYGDPFSIYGQLVCPSPEQAEKKQVTIYQHAAGAPGFTVLGTAMTEKAGEQAGAYTFTPPPFSTNTTFYVLAEGARSAHRLVRVAPVVTLAMPSEGAKILAASGKREQAGVTFAGTVAPLSRNVKGATVALQREDSSGNEEWHRIGRLGEVNRDGTYAITHVFHVPGTAELRIVVHPHDGFNSAGASSPQSYVISQPQNPLLTIEPGSDPLTVGESTSIGGEVSKAADGMPVKLLERNRGGQFVEVAETTTKGARYRFTRAPLENAAFKAVSGASSSSILIEGVRDAITLAPPPVAIGAGQPVTLKGTVTGAQLPHNVYLERKNLSSVGFHVIDIAPLTAVNTDAKLSGYSFEHAFRGMGVSEIRIKVPGEAGHLGKATAPIKLTVSPAPAFALTPELPVKLPPKGKI